MDRLAQHTIVLQDGTLCNFTKRFRRHQETLLQALDQVGDGRSKYGKRYTLSVILFVLFGGITQGSTTLKDCHLWALHNRKWLKQHVPSFRNLPDPTTISRALQKVDMDSLVRVYGRWQTILSAKATVASFDGKTLNGVHGAGLIKHVLSLFTHETHQILGQVGVTQKENEIPAAKRLFEQADVHAMLLIGDALHTQKETAKAIIAKEADYLFVVKENHEHLREDLAFLFSDSTWQQETSQSEEYGHNRYIQTTITLIHEPEVVAYFQGWKKLWCVGKLRRIGERTEKGETRQIDETGYFLASKKGLTATAAGKHLREHWQIENNLHWQKDYTFLEDRQTLRRGTAPLVMTFLKSMCISLFAFHSFASVTTTIANFQKSPALHQCFLTAAGILSSQA